MRFDSNSIPRGGRSAQVGLGMPRGNRERSERLNRCMGSHVGRQPAAVLADRVRLTMSRPVPICARIRNALTDEPMSTLQLAERACITARRRGEVVKLACDVLKDEGLIECVAAVCHPKWRRPTLSTAETCINSACPPAFSRMPPSLDERLARELVQGLAQSAVARGTDPAARLLQFRTLQQAAIAMSPDPILSTTAEQLVRAVNLILQELTPVNS